MDKLTFISTLVSSLAWPLAAIVGFLTLRDPIAKAIPLIKKIKYKDMDIEFNRISEPPQTPDAALRRVSHQENHMLVPIESLFEIARVSPKVAVMEAGRSLKYELDRSVDRFLDAVKSASENKGNNKISTESPLLNPALIELGKLLQIREDLVGNPQYEVTEKNANKYIIAANKYCGLIKSIHIE